MSRTTLTLSTSSISTASVRLPVLVNECQSGNCQTEPQKLAATHSTGGRSSGEGEGREIPRLALLNASLNRLRMTLNHLMLFASHCGWRQVKDIDVAPTLSDDPVLPPPLCPLSILSLCRSGEALCNASSALWDSGLSGCTSLL